VGKFLVTRLWQSAITLLLASIVVFIGVRQLPGDPAIAMAGEDASPQRLAELRRQLGMDEPIVVQYARMAAGFLRGDWGRSTRTGAPVTGMVADTLPVTLALALYATLIAVAVGVVLGVVAERFRGRWPEWLANGTVLVWLSVPNFWLGLLGILLFAVTLGWLPASGLRGGNLLLAIRDLTLPALVLSTGIAAAIMRQTRSSMIATMRTDYVRTARAKGLPSGRVLLSYGLRNSLIVVVTIVGLQFGGLITGAVVTERVFALPGFGKLILDSVFTRDYPVIQAVVLITTTAYVVINLGVDVLYSIINPRIRTGAQT
jgi:peptide/nickel transport system permease protein